MAAAVLEALRAEIERNNSVDASAIALINGFADRVAAAVAKALENGATAEELAPVAAEVDALRGSSDALAAAVSANTPQG